MDTDVDRKNSRALNAKRFTKKLGLYRHGRSSAGPFPPVCIRVHPWFSTSGFRLSGGRAGGALRDRAPLFITRLVFFLLTILGLTSGLMTPGARADELTAVFEKGNKFYEEGKYANAVTAYDQLLNAGNASEAIYFNRGNAYFKLGQVGRAIASYRMALCLTPRDPEARANLQFARTRARGGSAYHAGMWRGWFDLLTLNEWTCLTTGAMWLLFILLALRQWRPELNRALGSFILAGTVAAVLLGFGLAAGLADRYLNQSAVVIAGEADVRNGPLEESQSIYKVRDGVELGVLDRKDGWLQVVDPAQRAGWLREDQVLILEPSALIKPKPSLVLH